VPGVIAPMRTGRQRPEPVSTWLWSDFGGVIRDLTAPAEVLVAVRGSTVAAMTEGAARPTHRDFLTGTSERPERTKVLETLMSG
jgi:hypothetical protein